MAYTLFKTTPLLQTLLIALLLSGDRRCSRDEPAVAMTRHGIR